jgi:hypothetical protein
MNGQVQPRGRGTASAAARILAFTCISLFGLSLHGADRMTPGGKWKAGDMARPRPPVISPAAAPGAAPGDAIVLFDGKDLGQWKGAERPGSTNDAPRWKVRDGYFEVVPGTGAITTRDKFGDCQLHVEWATPAEVSGNGQGRGNSGLFMSGHAEVQILDSYDNDTYADGQAAALYNRYPPMVNASRKPGEWQSYDLIYIAPRLDDQGKVTEPARYTVFHNGVLVHHNMEVPGSAVECPITLQEHKNPIRFRNVWVRLLKPAP